MFKVFRRLRHRSISSEKYRKYFWYALGEIFLVVIGILIALQINSWNQFSKDRKLERDYYLQFKSELEENVGNADDQIQHSTWQIENAQIVEFVMDTDSLYEDAQKLYIAIEHLTKTYPTQYMNNVWSELLSNGKTLIMRNRVFRERLAFLDSEMQQAIQLQNELNESNYRYERLLGDIFSIGLTNELDSKMHPRELRDSSEILNLPEQAVVVKTLKAINGLGAAVADINQNKTVNKYLFTRHRALMLELIEMCEAELSK